MIKKYKKWISSDFYCLSLTIVNRDASGALDIYCLQDTFGELFRIHEQ